VEQVVRLDPGVTALISMADSATVDPGEAAGARSVPRSCTRDGSRISVDYLDKAEPVRLCGKITCAVFGYLST
jgi:hypothetical protein